MEVEFDESATAPFFVYGHQSKWKKITLPPEIKNISDLQNFILSQLNTDKPFIFKLEGSVNSAEIHIQNLPAGSTVSSPQEAHQGQINYWIENEEVEIIGFFSQNHQGVFTHHDSYMHMHLITKDETKMGHLDAVEFDDILLFLPEYP